MKKVSVTLDMGEVQELLVKEVIYHQKQGLSIHLLPLSRGWGWGRGQVAGAAV